MSVRQRPQGELLRSGRETTATCITVPFPLSLKAKRTSGAEWKSVPRATSVTMLFECKADGTFVRVEGVETYPLEDPFFLKIAGEYILGGTHVVKEKGKIKTYYSFIFTEERVPLRSSILRRGPIL